MNLMQKIERLIDLMIAHYESKNQPALPLNPEESTAPKPRKTRAPKVEAAAPAAPAGDPLMQGDETAPATAAAPAAVLTEQESLDRAKDLAKKLCETFSEPEANNRPRGFNLAMGLLNKHKVARATDLIHSQRLSFIAEAEALLAKAE